MPIGAFRINSLAKFTVTAAAEVIRARNSIVAFDNAQIDTAQSKFGGSSAVFDGVGDYLRAATTGFLYPPGNDVTMELWFRIETTVSGEFNGLISLGNVRGASSNEWTMFVMQNSATGFNRRLQMGHNYSILIGSTTNLNIDQWYHVAATRSGTTFTLWLDGVSQGTYTGTLTLGQGTGAKVGSHNDGTLVHRGWIDEVRISNTARYTTAFTPSTTAFTSDSNTQLLLHMDGSDRSPFFVDDNGNIDGRSAKGILTIGNAQVDTAQSKFGGASALFDGSGDFLRIVPGNTDFNFSTNQDFTIELFVRMNSNNNTRIFWTLFDGATARAVLYTTSTQLSFYAPALGGVSLGDNPSTGVWYHLAVSRSGNTTKIFYNGTETYSTTTSWTGTSDRIVFGVDNESTAANPYDGWMDEIRVSNTARYTASFTPTTEAFTNDANTLLLIHANGSDASTEFVDDAPGLLSSVTQMLPVDAVTSTASTITIPTWALADDYAVLFDYSTTTTLTVPSGWTQVTTSTTTGIRSTVSYKKLVSGDINTSITGMGGTTRKVLVIVRGNAPVSSITLSTPSQQATTATPTNQTISMSGSLVPVMGFAHYTSTGAITTRTGTGNLREYTSTTNQYVKVWAYSPAQSTNITVGQSDNGTNALQSFWIRFNP